MSIDFQKVADSFAAMTAVISVEKREDGSCGDIRIVTGNEAYIGSIEHPMGDVVMMRTKFTPNSLYTDYMTRDLNFEDFCYRAAVQKKCLHSYAHPDRYEVWFNMIFMPLAADDGNTCYCTYTMEVDMKPSSERMSNISGDIAAPVLETAITMRATEDFRAAMKDAVEETRKLCDAEHCCILGLDAENETCHVLGESYREGSNLIRLRKSDDSDFYKIARTWKDTILGSNCIIAKDDRDMEVVRERNQIWYDSLKEAGVNTVALFPLKVRSEHLGYMWAVNFKPEQAARIKEILELTSFVLGAEISNYLMVKQLKILSSRDMLTGVMNRNEMNIRVAELSGTPAGSAPDQNPVGADQTPAVAGSDQGPSVAGSDQISAAGGASDQNPVGTEQGPSAVGPDQGPSVDNQNPAVAAEPGPAAPKNSVGVIFTDLNGLKRTNDSQGHHAGDILLKKAASVFKEMFDEAEIFRAGGDEFVVLLTGITEDELNETAENLKQKAAEDGVSFAIGWSYENDAQNVRRALADADQKMYDDKMQYYAKRK